MNTESELEVSIEKKEEDLKKCISIEGNLFLQELQGAEMLLEFAINANLDVSDQILQAIASSRNLEEPSSEDIYNLKKAVRDLTSLTYPTTISSIKASEAANPNKQLSILIVIALPALMVAIFLGHSNAKTYAWAPSVIAVCLGLLGSIVNVFFHIIGVMKERVITQESNWENVIRVVLGGILGWLLFLAIRPELFLNAETNQSNLLVLAPFLAGFSTQLVFGVLNQSIKAVEITLGIKNSSTEITKRGRNVNNKE